MLQHISVPTGYTAGFPFLGTVWLLFPAGRGGHQEGGGGLQVTHIPSCVLNHKTCSQKHHIRPVCRGQTKSLVDGNR